GAPPTGLTLTPPLNFNGTISLVVTATTQDGAATATSTATHDVIVHAVNDRPVASVLADQNGSVGAAFSFTLPDHTFTDVDGDALSLSADLVGGGTFPSWLSFDPATGQFSGTPGANDFGSYEIAVTARDPGGLDVSSIFTLTIALPDNSAPTVVDDHV